MSKTVKQITDIFDRHDMSYQIARNRGSVIIWQLTRPDGTSRKITTSLVPNDHRAIKNIEGDVRKFANA